MPLSSLPSAGLTGPALAAAIITNLAPLLYAWWLFQIWRRKREQAYVWLLAGVGLVPLLSSFLILAIFFGTAASGAMAGGAAAAPSIGIMALVAGLGFGAMMLEALKYGCFFMALGSFAAGAVRFRDLFLPAGKPREPGGDESI